ncbi:MAG: tryptophan halogenase family protein [Planctomycetota bacterium]
MDSNSPNTNGAPVLNGSSSRKVNRVVVLGGGSAGFLVALAIKKHLPDTPLVVVRSTKMGVIGVGEGTIWSVVNFLHRFLGLDPARFHRDVRPTLKLGIHYLWGSRPFFNYTFAPQLSQPLEKTNILRGYFCDEECDYADIASALMTFDKACLRLPNGQPQILPNHAYHLENRRFVGFLESISDEWGIEKIDDLVNGVEQDESGIKALLLESGNRVEGDLFIDASGFRSELIGKALDVEFVDFSNELYCDSAIFGGWERNEEDVIHPYTTAETMDAGWSWRIEHDEVVNRGYVFCSKYISDEDADAEFRRKNPHVEMTKCIKFRPGVRRKTWHKNVIAVGNSAGFVEPLEATAIGMICDSAVNIVRALAANEGHIHPVQAEAYSRIQFENWEIIRDFLALHYKFNDRLDTPFWNAAQEETPLGRTEKIVDYYRVTGPDMSLIGADLKRDFFDLEGYLSMLVGQKVPYERKIEFSLQERNQWKVYKNRLRDSMYSAMDMRECLTHLRGENAFANPNKEGATIDINSPHVGELQWH